MVLCKLVVVEVATTTFCVLNFSNVNYDDRLLAQGLSSPAGQVSITMTNDKGCVCMCVV